MLKLSFIIDLHNCFPNARVSCPTMNASYLFDDQQNMMGHFAYDTAMFHLSKDYEFLNEAKHVLNKHEVAYAEKKYSDVELLYG